MRACGDDPLALPEGRGKGRVIDHDRWAISKGKGLERECDDKPQALPKWESQGKTKRGQSVSTLELVPKKGHWRASSDFYDFL